MANPLSIFAPDSVLLSDPSVRPMPLPSCVQNGMLARAFVKDPRLYVLDEPLHGLDEPQRRRVKSLLDRFCGAPGKTLLMVTHYPEEYPACIDHSLTL